MWGLTTSQRIADKHVERDLGGQPLRRPLRRSHAAGADLDPRLLCKQYRQIIDPSKCCTQSASIQVRCITWPCSINITHVHFEVPWDACHRNPIEVVMASS
jgi:hypothetical protein